MQLKSNMNPQTNLQIGAKLSRTLVPENIITIPTGESNTRIWFEKLVYNTFPSDPFNEEHQFVAPDAGFYRFEFSLEVQGVEFLVARLHLPDGTIDSPTKGVIIPDINDRLVARASKMVYLNTGDIVVFEALQFSGSDKIIFPINPSNFFDIEYLG